jgi:TRAP-type mannitol/chloroaromatic compound transport system permease small subunit
MNRFLFAVDRLSAATGKTCAWSIVLLTLIVCYDVFTRYFMNRPTQWGFDAAYILYGTLFMMAGAYTLARKGHVRADMLYGTLPPRAQAALDLLLYCAFFIPGIAALIYAGTDFALASWRIREVSSVTSAGTPIYPFKLIIPLAGALLLLQGIAEICRCLLCLRRGEWPARPRDVGEDLEDLRELVDRAGTGARA